MLTQVHHHNRTTRLITVNPMMYANDFSALCIAADTISSVSSSYNGFIRFISHSIFRLWMWQSHDIQLHSCISWQCRTETQTLSSLCTDARKHQQAQRLFSICFLHFPLWFSNNEASIRCHYSYEQFKTIIASQDCLRLNGLHNQDKVWNKRLMA